MYYTRKQVLKLLALAAGILVIPKNIQAMNKSQKMLPDSTDLDVVIIGGSYAGLSAAMALGRALRHVLIIDSGQPCNWQTPHTHNFITQDGVSPEHIRNLAKQQVLQYSTVAYLNQTVASCEKLDGGFRVTTQTGQVFKTKKLIFATGVKDIMPDIKGFDKCWGISAIHCPYCHGYEVRNKRTGILANGEDALHYAQLIYNWTKQLFVFTNGPSALTTEQLSKLQQRGIAVLDKEISHIEHTNGYLNKVAFTDGSSHNVDAIYHRPVHKQHCTIPQDMGCTVTELGYIQVDQLQKTSVKGVLACGDSTSMMRSLAFAVASGNMAGAAANNELIKEEF